jgi:hypothetical protein
MISLVCAFYLFGKAILTGEGIKKGHFEDISKYVHVLLIIR